MSLQSALLCFLLTVLGYTIPPVRMFRMLASEPVNPIEETGILSLHCQVWDLPKSHEVRLHRTLPNGETGKISVDETVLAEDERYFLAKRQLDGASFVYFMSVMDVTREDGGDYTCKVYNTTAGEMSLLGSETVNFGIIYFPTETDPVCTSSSSESLEFDAGAVVTLTCTSEKANPVVQLQWSRTGEDKVYDIEQEEEGDYVYSKLKLTLQRRHNNAMFWCKVSSKSFPEEISTCHIGPFIVHSDPHEITTDIPEIDLIPKVTNGLIKHPNDGQDTSVSTEKKPKDCRTFCSSTSSLVFQWIVATIVAAGLALMFFIIGIVLLIKYNNARTTTRSPYVPSRTHDDIYSELEGKRPDNTSYMYLHYTKPMNSELQIRDSPARQYDGNQNLGKN